MMKRLFYSVRKQNGREGPNLDEGNNNKNPNGKTRTTTFNKG
jgi:hypothetical protein